MNKLVLLVLLLTISLCLAKKPSPNKIPKPKNPKKQLENSPKIQKPCILRDTGTDGEKVCVCNSTYCDNILRPTKLNPPFFIKYTTSRDGLRFFQESGRFKNGNGGTKSLKRVYINHQKRYQEILGFGGAFTDSTGINIKSLDENAQDLLLASYFGDDGIEYNLCRVPIGCTDFSTRPYSYDDTDGPDPNLVNFTLVDEDRNYKIPLMLKAKELNRELNFFGSPWTSPRWMKTDNQWSGRESYIKKEYYQAWAEYILRFLEEYMNNGFYFWGITTQNEPTFGAQAPIPIPLVRWEPEELGVWIGKNLGPTIRNSDFRDIKIVTDDDQLNQLPWMPESILRAPDARKYVNGIATHWYFTNITSPNQIAATRDKFPDLMLMSTEAATGFRGSTGVDFGSWESGENYGSNIIEMLKYYYVSWTDWNMVLNRQGGPSYIKNYIDAPIIADASAGEFYKQPMYYFIGHFSKFLPPGAVRIDCKHEFDDSLEGVSFTIPDNNNGITDDDGATVVVILNRSGDDRSFVLDDDLMGTATVTVPKRSISTILYWPNE